MTDNEYDSEKCVTAGELRQLGIPIPEGIPDVAWVPRTALFMCEHAWFYLGGHNEWWVCRKCGVRERR